MNMAQRVRDARIPRQYAAMTRQAWQEQRVGRKPSPWPVDVSRWAAGERGPFLALFGGTGVGKTHVAVATLQHYLCGQGRWDRPKWWMRDESERLGGVYFHARELADEYQQGRFRGRPLLERGLQEPLVVVDDVAWDRTTEDFQRGAVAALILNSEQSGMGLILTTNLPLSVLADPSFDRRIVSRLETGFILDLKGEDRR